MRSGERVGDQRGAGSAPPGSGAPRSTGCCAGWAGPMEPGLQHRRGGQVRGLIIHPHSEDVGIKMRCHHDPGKYLQDKMSTISSCGPLTRIRQKSMETPTHRQAKFMDYA